MWPVLASRRPAARVGRLSRLWGPAVLRLAVAVVVPGRARPAMELRRCSGPGGRLADAVAASEWTTRGGHRRSPRVVATGGDAECRRGGSGRNCFRGGLDGVRVVAAGRRGPPRYMGWTGVGPASETFANGLDCVRPGYLLFM